MDGPRGGYEGAPATGRDNRWLGGHAAGDPDGSPSRSLLNDGLRVLTERERVVARLAAYGYTNKEIAGRLYVTDKTVEFHLSNIFAKLNIRSRRHLRDLTRPP